jgi:hypothetical protein
MDHPGEDDGEGKIVDQQIGRVEASAVDQDLIPQVDHRNHDQEGHREGGGHLDQEAPQFILFPGMVPVQVDDQGPVGFPTANHDEQVPQQVGIIERPLQQIAQGRHIAEVPDDSGQHRIGDDPEPFVGVGTVCGVAFHICAE